MYFQPILLLFLIQQMEMEKNKNKIPYYTILHAPSQNVNHQKGKDGCFQSKTPFKYVATHND
jgi:hypothetical protein